jgi:preprotein translocase subunit SecE
MGACGLRPNAKDKRSMATKAALANQDNQSKMPGFVNRAADSWKEFTHFLSDVRGEMRKVVTPSRKEVETTTTVVIIAVFIFGLFFFLTDSIFSYGLTQLLKQLGGLSQ